MSRRPDSDVIHQTVLQACGLRLVVMATHDVDDAVWALTSREGRERVRHAAGGHALLHEAYVVDTLQGEAAVAVGSLPDGEVSVRFTTRGLRWRHETTVPARHIGHGLWVAEAGGGFDFVVVSVDGKEELTATMRRMR